MAVRQYIGARYVPLYVGDWDQTKNYEPLSIVTDANGNSFTSLKDVPAGTQLTDRNYWIQTSSFSGAVDQLRRVVNRIDNDVATLQRDVDQIDNDVAKLDYKKADKGHVAILIGDSFSVGVTGSGLPWATGGGWFERMITANGLVRNETVFTSEIVTEEDVPGLRKFSQNTFTMILQKMIEKIPSEKLAKISDIIVLGGTNDYGAGGTYPASASTEIEKGIKSFIDTVKTTWAADVRPRVKIGILMCNTNQTKNFVDMQRETIEAYRNCQKYGATYILNSEYIMSNKEWISTDGGHPNQLGYDHMERYTNGLLESDHVDVYRSEVVDALIDNSGAFSSPNVNTAQVMMHNNVMRLTQTVANYFIEYDIKEPVQKGTSFMETWTLGKINSDLLNANGLADTTVVPITGIVLGENHGAAVSWHIACGQLLFINGGNVAVRVYANGAEQAGIVKKLILTPISVELPTDLYKY